MVFFDFNIPFLESPDQTSESSKPGRKNVRLKIVVKAMELGYSGIAYNRTIKGVMSDSDRCRIPLFPLSSLLKAAPALSSAVRFHRELLGVRLDSPFRQYTRLTVVIESVVHAAALNSGNPILKTYDIVAVRPLNQIAFDHACKVSEVDLISIDFSQKLPFRLKFPMVKAAMERGIYFEITYSHLISDVQARRVMLSGAKLLVDWTRGKNLIISSAAPTANELRGPYDVANLSSLLGLSMERAKAAISKNCRSLIANALRKKHFYKEVIRIEKVSDNELLNSKGDWFGDWHGWDPISSGEGDLSFDDVGKFLSAAHNLSRDSNGTDVISDADRMPLRRMQLQDKFSISGSSFRSLDTAPFFFGAMECGSPATANKSLKQSHGLDVVSVADGMPLTDTSLQSPVSCSEGDLMLPMTDGMPLAGTPLKNSFAISHSEDDRMSPNDPATCIPVIQDLEPTSGYNQGPSSSNGFDIVPVALKKAFESTQSDVCSSISEDNLLLLDDSLTLLTASKDIKPSAASNEDLEQSNGLHIVSVAVGMPSYVTPPLDESLALSSAANIMDVSDDCNEDPIKSDMSAEDLAASERQMEGILTKAEKQEQQDASMWSVPFRADCPKIELQGQGADRLPSVDGIMLEEAFDEMNNRKKGDVVSVADDLILEEVEMKERKQEDEVQQINRVLMHKASPVKGKCKRKSLHLARSLPFLRMLKPVIFKRTRQKR